MGSQEAEANATVDVDVDIETNTPHADRDRDRPRASHEYEYEYEYDKYGKAAQIDDAPLERELSGKHPPTDPSTQVGWDGPDDPENPRNFRTIVKIRLMATLSLISFFVPLGSSMFAPLISQVLEEFNSDDQKQGSLCISIFVLGFAFGPLWYGPMSELYGRAITLHISNVAFVVCTLSCGFVNSLGALTGVRFLAGLVGSAVFAIGGGMIADLFEPNVRGRAVACWTLGPLIAPAIGPIAGGFMGLNPNVGFRWVFWVLAICHGIVTAISFFSLIETNPIVLLERRASRLRRTTGNLALTSVLALDVTPRELFYRSISRPFKVMYQSALIDVLSLVNGSSYSLLFIMLTTFPLVFSEVYGFGSGTIGLVYLGLGIGSMLPVCIIFLYSDRLFLYLCRREKVQRAENRLFLCFILVLSIPGGLVWYGWSAQERTHWIVPILGTSYMSIGIVGTWLTVQGYLIDAFGVYAASAAAANTFIRSVLAALIPLAGPPLYNNLGLGWGNTLLAFISFLNLPIVFVIYKYGDRIREKYPIDL